MNRIIKTRWIRTWWFVAMYDVMITGRIRFRIHITPDWGRRSSLDDGIKHSNMIGWKGL